MHSLSSWDTVVHRGICVGLLVAFLPGCGESDDSRGPGQFDAAPGFRTGLPGSPQDEDAFQEEVVDPVSDDASDGEETGPPDTSDPPVVDVAEPSVEDGGEVSVDVPSPPEDVADANTQVDASDVPEDDTGTPGGDGGTAEPPCVEEMLPSWMFFTDVGSGTISFVGTGGSQLVPIINGVDADDIVIDPIGQKLYWPDNDTSIMWANMDGTGVDTLLSDLGSPYGIALDPVHGKIYWTNQITDPRIQRANLDGTEIEDLVPGSGCCTIGIAVDGAGGKMYWMGGYYGGPVSRANLDGTGVEVIGTTVGIANGIALDTGAGKVYWTEYGNGGADDVVRRANLDGSSVQTLLSPSDGLQTPQGIAIDPVGGKFYLIDLHAGRLQRANLDGTGLETILSGLDNPRGIALSNLAPCENTSP